MPRPPVVQLRAESPLSVSLQPSAVNYEALPPLLSSGGAAKNENDDGVNKDQKIFYNAPAPVLYEQAISKEKGTQICANGALGAFSYAKTGRSPKDKRIVEEPSSVDDVWWGPVNMKLQQKSFLVNRERAVDYLNLQDQLYVFDGFAGWDLKYRVKVRVVCSRAYHALFMNNMLIRPTDEELENFGTPDITIYNAGCFSANRFTEGMSSACSVALNLSPERREMVILGTQYAGEMKKGILTLMMYLMPKQGTLCLHSSCNEAKDGTTTLFFGLSGTGKTTLSADPERLLIGDDEHVWTDEGVFNVEGGCYAKCINLSRENEPEIFDAIRFGAIVENVAIDSENRGIDYSDVQLTENTRCAYPLEFIPNAKLPAVGLHPTNVVMLTCDAFGVLPPVSRLSPEQAMFQFISGYTAKVAGTEAGVTEPTPTFSACFGGPFLVWHPCKYADMLAEKLQKHKADAWLLNTGWVGGMPGSGGGSRIKLKYTRAMVDAIHSGELAKAEFEKMPGFGVEIPKTCTGVPEEVLFPWKGWSDQDAYKKTLNGLAERFRKNFAQYEDQAAPALKAVIPADWA